MRWKQGADKTLGLTHFKEQAEREPEKERQEEKKENVGKGDNISRRKWSQ